MNSLLLHEIGHASFYFLLILPFLYLLYKNRFPVREALFGLLVTIGLDADHLLDYMLYKKWLGFSWHEFLVGDYFKLSGKIYVVLHSWELVLVFLIAYFASKRRNNLALFIALGIAAQIIFDTVSYRFYPEVYFFSYRFLNNFSEVIFTRHF